MNYSGNFGRNFVSGGYNEHISKYMLIKATCFLNSKTGALNGLHSTLVLFPNGEYQDSSERQNGASRNGGCAFGSLEFF